MLSVYSGEKCTIIHKHLLQKENEYVGDTHIWELNGKIKKDFLTFIRISSIGAPCKGANMFIILTSKKIDQEIPNSRASR